MPPPCLGLVRGTHLGQRSPCRVTGRTHDRRRTVRQNPQHTPCTQGAVHTCNTAMAGLLPLTGGTPHRETGQHASRSATHRTMQAVLPTRTVPMAPGRAPCPNSPTAMDGTSQLAMSKHRLAASPAAAPTRTRGAATVAGIQPTSRRRDCDRYILRDRAAWHRDRGRECEQQAGCRWKGAHLSCCCAGAQLRPGVRGAAMPNGHGVLPRGKQSYRTTAFIPGYPKLPHLRPMPRLACGTASTTAARSCRPLRRRPPNHRA